MYIRIGNLPQNTGYMANDKLSHFPEEDKAPPDTSANIPAKVPMRYQFLPCNLADRILIRRLNTLRPNRNALKNAVRQTWSSTIYELADV